MKLSRRNFRRLSSAFLVAMAASGRADPQGGCTDLPGPGGWTNRWTSTDRTFEMGDGQSYWISPGYLVEIHPDTAGKWDSIQQYSGASAQLKNNPGASWYSPDDTNAIFEVPLASMVVKARITGGSPTNTEHVEMEIAAHSGRFAFVAIFEGTPTLTNVPETLESTGFSMATGGLNLARFCFRNDPPTSPSPSLSIDEALSPSAHVQLSWNSATNRLYQIQSCSDLIRGTWEDWQWPVAGTGTNLHAIDVLEPTTTQRFFRCVEFP